MSKKKLLSFISSRNKIEKILNILPTKTQFSFRQALSPYKFKDEIFIPNSLEIKKEFSNKNYFYNDLVKFNQNLYYNKKKLKNLNNDTNKFSKQYKLIRAENENNNNNYLYNVTELYKINGYDMKNLNYTKKDNLFDQSILTENDKNIENTLKKENYFDIKKETNYLYKTEKIIINKEYKPNEEEKNKEIKKRKIKFKNINEINKKHQKKLNEIKLNHKYLNNISLKDLKTKNNNLKKEINDIEYSLKCLSQENIFDDNKNKNNKLIYKIKTKNLHNFLNNNKKSKTNLISINNKKMFRPKSLNNINEQEYKSKKLNNIYNRIMENNYENESKNIFNYIEKYTNFNLPTINYQKGSNLRSMFKNMKNNSKNLNTIKIASNINDIYLSNYNKYEKNNDKDKIKFQYLQEKLKDINEINKIEKNLNKSDFYLIDQLLNEN